MNKDRKTGGVRAPHIDNTTLIRKNNENVKKVLNFIKINIGMCQKPMA